MSRLKRFLEPRLRPAWQLAMRQTRGLTLGVRAMVFDGQGRVLLVEHSYTPGWYLPGGGVERGETAEQALVRELEEEAGIRPDTRPVLLSMHSNARLFRGDHVLVYRVDLWTPCAPTSRGEILRVDWFDPRDPPAGTTAGARRRLAEALDGAPPDLFW